MIHATQNSEPTAFETTTKANTLNRITTHKGAIIAMAKRLSVFLFTFFALFAPTMSAAQNPPMTNATMIDARAQFQATGGCGRSPNQADFVKGATSASVCSYSAGGVDYGHVSDWNVSQVTDMEDMFNSAGEFNQDISAWDVSNVTNMRGMFQAAANFNQDIGDWTVSNVEDMTDAFESANAFNADISGWDVSGVTTMRRMFQNAHAFNQNIGGWDVSNVTNMGAMFTREILATDPPGTVMALDQDIRDWTVGNSVNLINMFANNPAMIARFDGVTGFGNSGNGYTPTSVFFNQGDVSTLDGFTGVTTTETFVTSTTSYTATATAGALTLGIDLSRPRGTASVVLTQGGSTSSVTVGDPHPVTGVAALSGATIASGTNVFDITVTSPASTSLTRTYTLSVTGIAPVVAEAGIEPSADTLTVAEGATTTFTVQLGSAPTSSVTVTPSVSDASEVRFSPATLSFTTSTWNTPQTVTVAGVYDAFPDGTQTSTLTLTAASADSGYSGITSTVGMTITDVVATPTVAVMNNGIFNAARAAITTNCINASDQGSVRKGQAGASACVYYDGTTNYGHISDWNTASVTTMEDAFRNLANFNQDISGWNTASVTNMGLMFGTARAFNQDIGGWDVSSVTDMSSMFWSASAFNQDIGDWDTSNVRAISGLFSNSAAFNQDISGWDMSNATNVQFMFFGATAFDQDIRDWDTGAVTSGNYASMFNNAAAMIARFGSGGTTPVASFDVDAGANITPTAAFFNQGSVSTLDGITGVTVSPTFAAATQNYTATAAPGALNLSIDLTRPTGAVAVTLSQNGGTSTPVTVGAINPVTGVADLASVNIASGTNVFSIIVTSPASTSLTTTYTLRVTGKVPVAEIITSPTSVTVAEGSTVTFTVQLGKAPTSSVTVTPSASDASEVRFSPATLSFSTSTWNTPQTVTVAGVFDTVTDGTQTSTLTLTASGAGSGYSGITSAVAVTTTDVASTTPAAMTNDIFNAARTDATYIANCLNEPNQGSVRKGVASAHHCVYYSGTTNYGHISDWNTSNVNNMQQAFNGQSDFNQDIRKWDTSAVTNMTSMFVGANDFNQPIAGWDVSSVTNMFNMFRFAGAFDQDIRDWDTGSITDPNNYDFMFRDATAMIARFGPSSTAPVASFGNAAGNYTPTSAFFNQGSVSTLDGITGVTTTEDFTSASTSYSATVVAGALALGIDLSRPRGAASVVLTQGGSTSSVTVGDINPVTGVAALSGFTIAMGSNVFTITVTSPDGTASTPYTLTITGAVAAEIITSADAITVAEGSTTTFTVRLSRAPTAEVTVSLSAENTSASFATVPDLMFTTSTWNTAQTVTMVGFYDAKTDGTQTSTLTLKASSTDAAYNNEEEQIAVTTTDETSPTLAAMNQTIFDNAMADSGYVDLCFVPSGQNSLIKNATSAGSCVYYSGATNYGHISEWNTTEVTDMTAAFSMQSNFNQNISDWDTQNVASMASMFSGAAAFNQPIGGWDTAEVTNMDSMFSGATAFNQNIGGWTTAKVTNMHSMFHDATNFNQDISGWDTKKVTNMHSMFHDATNFNQDISGWDTKKVTNMQTMFQFTDEFNQPIGAWDTASVTNMRAMFHTAKKFNQPLVDWNTAGVTDMLNMFKAAAVFDQDIRDWSIGASTVLTTMFSSSTAMNTRFASTTGYGDTPTVAFFNQKAVSTLDGITGITLEETFAPATESYTADAAIGSALALGIDLSRPKSTATATLSVNGGTANAVNVGDINPVTGQATLATATIASGTNVFTITVTSPDESDTTTYRLTVSSVYPAMTNATMADARSQFTANTSACYRNPNQASLAKGAASSSVCSYSAGGVDYGHISDWNVSEVTDMEDAFANAQQFNQDISAWDVSSVTTMRSMFASVPNFNQDIGGWNVSSVTDMRTTFDGATVFNQDIGRWDVSSVTNMGSMFKNAYSFNQDISEWDVSGVTSMATMFLKASDVDADMSFDQDIRDWVVGNSAVLGGMFTNSAGMIARFRSVAGFDSDGAASTAVTPLSTFFNQGNVSTLDNITGVVLSPSFAPTTRTYTAPALTGARVLSLDLSRPRGTARVVLAQGGATSSVAVGARHPVTGIADLASVDIASGTNLFTITVTSPDTSTSTTYTLTVTGSEGGISTSATSATVAEGATTSFTVALSSAPAGNVTLTPSVDDASEVRFSPATLTFTTTNWNATQTVTVIGLYDAFTDGTQTTALTLTANSSEGYNGATSTVRVITTDVINPTVPEMNNTIIGAAVTAIRTNCIVPNNQENIRKGAAGASACVYYDGTTNYGHISEWNTSGVTNMNRLFGNGVEQNFNQDIGDWDMSSVTNTSYMFDSARGFNQDISDWDVSNVSNMSNMFTGAAAFNQNISVWNMESATTLFNMFFNAVNFDQDIRDWDTGSVTDYRNMFDSATKMIARFDGVTGFDTNPSASIVTPSSAFFNQGDVSTLDDTTGITGVLLNEGSFVSSTETYTANAAPGALTLDLDLSRPRSAVAVTLSVNSGATSSVAVGAIDPVTGAADLASVNIAAGSNVFSISVTSPDASDTTTYTLTVTGVVRNIVTSATSVTVAEGATTSFTVALSATPTAGVSVALVGDDASEVLFSPATLSFSTSTWNTAQTVTMVGVYDARTDGAQTSAISLTATSTDGGFSGVTSSVSVTTNDAEPTLTAMNDTIFANAVGDATYRANCINTADQTLVAKTGTSSHLCVYLEGTTIYGHISDWDTSAVTDMVNAFADQSNFNQDISDWDVSSVTVMENMFSSSHAFNQDIGGWTVSAVENMKDMFAGALAFNADITDWDVSNVSNMITMFQSATAFDQDIRDWEVTITSPINLTNMFRTADAMIARFGDVPTFDLAAGSNVTPSVAFFNQGNVSTLDGISGVTTIETFVTSTTSYTATTTVGALTLGLDLSRPKGAASVVLTQGSETSSVTVGAIDPVTGEADLASVNIASGTNVFTITVTSPDASDTTTYTLTVTGITPPVVGSVTTSLSAITVAEGATANFTVALGATPTASVTVTPSVSDASEVRFSPATLTFTVDNWNVAQPLTVAGVFDTVTDGTQTSTLTLTASGAGSGYTNVTSTVGVTTTDAAATTPAAMNDPIFGRALADATYSASCLDNSDQASVAKGVASAHLCVYYEGTTNYGHISDWNTSAVTDMGGTLASPPFTGNFNQDISGWNTSNVTNMKLMFRNATAFNQNIGRWDVSSVTDMSDMFRNATAFNADISGWTTTEVTNMNSMFVSAEAFNQNIGSWDTSNVTLMGGMFSGAIVFNQDISSWDVSAVTSVRNMFNDAPAFDQDIRDWNTGSVTDYDDMFTSSTAMIARFGSVTGFGTTPTSAFFNQGVVDDLNRLSAVVNLDGATSNLTIAPTFSAGTVSYTATATLDSAVNLTIGLARHTATATVSVSVEGGSPTAVDVTSGPTNPGGLVTLDSHTIADGTNVFSINVTSQDGSANTTYTLSVESVRPPKGVVVNVDAASSSEADASTVNFVVGFNDGEAVDTTTTVVYALSGTAVRPTDYTGSAATGTLVIASGATSDTLSLEIVNDDYFEVNDTIIMTLTSVTGGDVILGTSIISTHTIVNDDNIGFDRSPDSPIIVAEGETNSYQLALTSRPTSDVTLTVSSGDVAGEASFSTTSVVFTNANWDTAQTVSITGIRDNLVDGDQGYTIELIASSADSNYDSIGVDVSATTTDVDSATVSLSSGPASTTESTSTLLYTVTLSTASDATTTLSYTISGSMTAGADYEGSDAGSVSIAPRASTGTIAVTLIDDDDVEGPEQMTVRLGAITASVGSISLGTPLSVSTEVSDNDAGVVVLEDKVEVEEGGTTTFSVKLSIQPDSDVTVTVSSTRLMDDSSGPSRVLSFGARPFATRELTFTPDNWDVPQEVEVTAEEDEDVVVDGDISFEITLNAQSEDEEYEGVTSTVEAEVLDTDTAEIMTSVSSISVSEAGTTTFTVELTSRPSGTVTVSVVSGDTTEGTVSPASLTFPAADWNTPQTVTLTGSAADDIADGSKDYTLTLTAASADANFNGVTTSVAATTLDADGSVISIAAPSNVSVSEATSTARLTIVQSVVSDQPTVIRYSLGGSATLGTDYTGPSAASGTVTIAAGATSTVFSITTTEDTAPEGDETIIFMLTSISSGVPTLGSPVQGVITIEDNDDIPSSEIEKDIESLIKAASEVLIATTPPVIAFIDAPSTGLTVGGPQGGTNGSGFSGETTVNVKAKDGSLAARIVTDGFSLDVDSAKDKAAFSISRDGMRLGYSKDGARTQASFGTDQFALGYDTQDNRVQAGFSNGIVAAQYDRSDKRLKAGFTTQMLAVKVDESASKRTLSFDGRLTAVRSADERSGTLNGWVSGQFVRNTGENSQTDVFAGRVGMHRFTSRDSLTGFVLTADSANGTFQRDGFDEDSKVSSRGYMLGIYHGSKVSLSGRALKLDLQGHFGSTNNTVTTPGGDTGSFSGSRAMLSGRASVDMLLSSGTTLSPYVQGHYLSQSTEKFTTTGGTEVDALSLSFVDLSAGARFGYSNADTDTRFGFEPGVVYRVNSSDEDDEKANQLRGKVSADVSVPLASGRLSSRVFYEGIGVENSTSYGGSIKYERNF